MEGKQCPLCNSSEVSPFHQKERYYYECSTCYLVFVDPSFFLSLKKERAIYDQHENGPEHLGYLAFLKRLAIPLVKKLPPQAVGLDFGCGPGPAMDSIFREYGFSLEYYDPFYFPQKRVLEKEYDFITCTEVVEHLRSPRATFLQISCLLKPAGFLGITTSFLEPSIDFATWWYARDTTHICFYRRKTMEWIANWRGWALGFPDEGVAIFTAP